MAGLDGRLARLVAASAGGGDGLGSRRLVAGALCVVGFTVAACGGGGPRHGTPAPTGARPPVGPAAVAPPVVFPARQSWLDEQESPTHVYTLSEAVAQATRFDLISALPESYDGYVPQMKAANPRLRLFVYLNATMANGDEAADRPEAWFLHDRAGGRLVNSYSLTLADPANQQWVQSRVNKCRFLLQHSGYDGCFLDNLGSGTWAADGLTGVPIDPATGRPYTVGAWLTRTAQLARIVGAQTGRPVFGNGLINGPSYLAGTAASSVLFEGSQIGCAETFLRDARQGITAYRPVIQWQQDLDMLAQASAQGRSIATIVKVWTPGTAQQIEDWHRFGLATFLLGADQHQYFEFSGSPRAAITQGDPALATLSQLGTPRGHYTVTNGLYQRQFTGGIVIVNPGDAPGTISLATSYTDALNGSKADGPFTVNPHQAWFLAG